MGEVWKAWDPELSRWVALKLLKGDDGEEVARFQREARTAARLRHPNIAAIHEVGSTGGRHWIAMEYVDGRTLGTMGGGDRRLLVSLVRDAARALAAAHADGVIHRDIKPDNLMVVERDGSHRVYLMDFGLARPAEGAGDLSRSGLVVGTPAYMSPEQARGERADARSDVWGLGATLYHLVAGRKPFAGDTALAVLKAVQETEPPPVRRAGRGANVDLETIILKCLEKEPERRYPSASALADELDRWLAGEAILARPPSIVYRLRKWTAHRKAVLAASLTAAAALGVAAWGIPQWLAERTARAEERRKAGEEIERQKARAQLVLDAEAAHARALLELNALRLRTYRKDLRLSDADFERLGSLARDSGIAMERAGETGDGWFVLGRVAETLGDERTAESRYRAGLARQPGHALCALHLARLLIERTVAEGRARFVRTGSFRGRAEAWLQEAQGLLAGATGLDEFEADLARGYERMLRQKPVGDYVDRMLDKWKGRDFREEFLFVRAMGLPLEARDATARLVEARPGLAEAWMWRGVVRAAHGDAEGAMADFTSALEIHPRYVPALVERASVMLTRGRPQDALSDLERAVKLQPRNPNALNCRANAHRVLGRLEEARADVEAALALDPDAPNLLANRGAVRWAQGDLDGARSDYDRSIDLEPDDAVVWSGRAELRRQLGDAEGAFRDATRSIELDGSRPEGWANRGLAREALGDPDGALADYEEAIRVRPTFANAYSLRGTWRVSRGDRAGAMDDFDRAIELDPCHGIALLNRGGLHLLGGRVEAALADFDRAVNLRPRQPEAWANRGMAHARLDRAVEAIADLEEALRVAPPGWGGRPSVVKLLERLRSER